jgi:hypothetical protein
MTIKTLHISSGYIYISFQICKALFETPCIVLRNLSVFIFLYEVTIVEWFDVLVWYHHIEVGSLSDISEIVQEHNQHRYGIEFKPEIQLSVQILGCSTFNIINN